MSTTDILDKPLPRKGKSSLTTLAMRARIALMKAPIGTCWTHYESGDLYEVTGVGFNVASGEFEFSYRPLATIIHLGHLPFEIEDHSLDNLLFHRSVSEWDELVVDGAGRTVPRFQRVDRINRLTVGTL